MAKLGLPYSGDSRATRVAARHASAFDLESRSSLHAFHTSRPCVTWVSNPLVLTRTSPAVGNSAPLNMASPTGFRAPLVPTQLWNAVHADMAMALTACWFSDKYFAASQQVHDGDVVLLPAADDGPRHVVHGHLDLCQ
jgi:hypothetical protein